MHRDELPTPLTGERLVPIAGRSRSRSGAKWLEFQSCATVREAGGNSSVVEHDLAKVGVAGSNPVSRSSFHKSLPRGNPAHERGGARSPEIDTARPLWDDRPQYGAEHAPHRRPLGDNQPLRADFSRRNDGGAGRGGFPDVRGPAKRQPGTARPGSWTQWLGLLSFEKAPDFSPGDVYT